MRAHSLQHAPFEDLGNIEPLLIENGHTLSRTLLYKDEKLPALDTFDLLIIMGGPMSVNDEDEYSWLSEEKAFIREVIKARKKVLGICLGAQLIANALGAKVYPNAFKEIGWFPIQGLPCADKTLFRFPEVMEVFHWHGDTFEIPEGATRLAKSEACDNQAFQYGDSVIGLQFHLEMNPESVRAIISNCEDELIPSPYVQSKEELLSAAPKKRQLIDDYMRAILSFLGVKLNSVV